MKNTFFSFAIILFTAAFLISCSDDDSNPAGSTQESGTFTVTIENAFNEYEFASAGVFNTPVGASSPAPAFPGDSYSFEFSAAPGNKLSFATVARMTF